MADARPLQRDGNTGAVAGSMAQLVERELQLAAAPAEALAPVRPTGACTPTPHGVRALRRSLNLNPEPARTPRRGSSGLGSRDPKPCAPAASAFAPAACEEARLLVDTRARGWAVLHANELAQRDLRARPAFVVAMEGLGSGITQTWPTWLLWQYAWAAVTVISIISELYMGCFDGAPGMLSKTV